MSAVGYTLFETVVGEVGIAWNDRAVTAIQLPDSSARATERRLQDKSDGIPSNKPPAFVRDAIKRIQKQLAGKTADLSTIPIELPETTPFRRRVYELTRRIPVGETRSYGELAEAAGSPGAARAVGQAMAQNPVALIVPCHRVLAAGGKLGGFSSPGGLTTKKTLLAIERREH